MYICVHAHNMFIYIYTYAHVYTITVYNVCMRNKIVYVGRCLGLFVCELLALFLKYSELFAKYAQWFVEYVELFSKIFRVISNKIVNQ